MHQRTDSEEAAAAEMPSQYLIANQNTFNHVTSEFQFPDMARGKENEFKSTHFQQPFEANTLFLNQNPRCGEASNSKYPANTPLPVAEPLFLPGFQQPFEANKLILNQNPQCGEASNSKYPANAPLPVAEPWCLPAFQQTFGQRNAMVNQISYPNESSQTECSGVSSHFASDFNETDNASTIQISQHYGTSLVIGILANQNAQYNPMDTIPSTGRIHSSICPESFLPKDDLEPQVRSRSVTKPYVCNFCGKLFSSRYDLTDHTIRAKSLMHARYAIGALLPDLT
ncbi:hypothetical protein CEXT_441821 [Caerostris extrusa]|uniref:C2H2-type domain-containing protein n=1 Tax=Caerostris extrusa TaxID=172846 RepID=A0AAV4VJE8_CAEEX|nr:hypothetical protein CEXT_441821 [Caerostris extrusa]